MQIKSFECKEFISFSLLHEDTFIVKQGPSDLSEETERLEERAPQDYS